VNEESMATDEDEEKTRVLARKPAAAGPKARRNTPPSATGRQIEFRCPQGHPIKVDAALAGKRGKCSKCQAPVTIPATSQPLEEEAASPEAAVSEPTMSPPPSPPPAPPTKTVPESPVDLESAGEQSADERENWDFIASHGESPPVEAFATEGFDAGGWSAPASDLGGEEQNPTAVLVARLWAEREHGGIIELHLAGGSVILPEWYDATWSRGTHGLFASQAADGSVTLTAVAWETVQKVVVRQLSEVPDDMFT
jgi:hypothetical protein